MMLAIQRDAVVQSMMRQRWRDPWCEKAKRSWQYAQCEDRMKVVESE